MKHQWTKSVFMFSVGALCLVCGTFSSMLAQTTTARILGEISDQTGAVLPGATPYC